MDNRVEHRLNTALTCANVSRRLWTKISGTDRPSTFSTCGSRRSVCRHGAPSGHFPQVRSRLYTGSPIGLRRTVTSRHTSRPRGTHPVTTLTQVQTTDREILRLAVPAFLALVAEPLFLLTDAAVVGHLGTVPLAGLGIAGAVLQTIVGLCVFLAYGTTAARRAPPRRRATCAAPSPRASTAAGWRCSSAARPPPSASCSPSPWSGSSVSGDAVGEQATTYLRIAIWGTTPLLLMLAATGVLRGLQDTRTPLWVAVGGNVANIVLNVTLVHGVDLGIAGSAIGSAARPGRQRRRPVAVVVRAARREGAPLSPDLPGIRAAARAGTPLVMRTLTLRACLLVGTYAATPGRHATPSSTWRPTRSPSPCGPSSPSPSTRWPSPPRRSPAARWGPATSRAPAGSPAGWSGGAGAAGWPPGCCSPACAPVDRRALLPRPRRAASCWSRCCSWPPWASRSPGWSSSSTAC